LGHLEGMCVPKVAVRLRNKQAAVFVSDPRGDGFEIDAGLDGVANEVMAQAVVRDISADRAS
jgi:hypothetical protein